MSWQTNGAGAWAGEKNTLNPMYVAHPSLDKGFGAVRRIGIGGALVTAPFLIFAVLFSLNEWHGIGSVLFIALPAALMLVCLWASTIGNEYGRAFTKAQFLREEWGLSLAGNRLDYRAHDGWAVAVGDVSRVEIAKTADYTGTRNVNHLTRALGVKPSIDFSAFKVPENEWQVFLFMADGTRRVVHHANADRDGCAALAASIRSALAAATAKPAAISAPPSQGFAL